MSNDVEDSAIARIDAEKSLTESASRLQDRVRRMFTSLSPKEQAILEKRFAIKKEPDDPSK